MIQNGGSRSPQPRGQPTFGYPSFGAYDMPVHIVGGQWVVRARAAGPGIGANWNVYPYTGWVGVVLSNYDNLPLAEMSQREVQAVTGQPVSSGGGG